MIRDRQLQLALGAVALIALTALVTVLLTADESPGRGEADQGARPGAPSATASDARATDRRDIQARALAYQKALDPESPNDPCKSIATDGDTAHGATDDLDLAAQGCAAVVRDRDSALQGARPIGVTDIRFVPRVEVGFGEQFKPGAKATWRADRRLTIGFIREGGRWVIAR